LGVYGEPGEKKKREFPKNDSRKIVRKSVPEKGDNPFWGGESGIVIAGTNRHDSLNGKKLDSTENQAN